MRFSKRKLHFLFLPFLCWRNRNRKRKKENGKGPKKPIKIGFSRWSCKNVKNQKTDILQKLPDTICVRKGEKRAFSCTLSVLAKNFLGPKQFKPRKTIKIVVSAEIAQNQK